MDDIRDELCELYCKWWIKCVKGGVSDLHAKITLSVKCAIEIFVWNVGVEIYVCCMCDWDFCA